jgi:hypothetical protein
MNDRAADHERVGAGRAKLVEAQLDRVRAALPEDRRRGSAFSANPAAARSPLRAAPS